MSRKKIVSFLALVGVLATCRSEATEPVSPIQSPCPSCPTNAPCSPCPPSVASPICTPVIITCPPTATPQPKPTPTAELQLPEIPFSSSRVLVFDAAPESLDDWSTYTNTEFGFSFSYPSHLVSDPCCSVGGPGEEIVSLVDLKTVLRGTDAPFDGFGVHIEDTLGQPFDSFIEERRGWLFYLTLGGPSVDPVERLEALTIRLGGRDGVLLGGYGDRFSMEDVYVPLSDDRHVLHIAKRSFVETESFDLLFDQVLSTFTFSDDS
jgi:hypothetical protein